MAVDSLQVGKWPHAWQGAMPAQEDLQVTAENPSRGLQALLDGYKRLLHNWLMRLGARLHEVPMPSGSRLKALNFPPSITAEYLTSQTAG